MLKKFKITFALLSRIVGMSVITVFAVFVMIAVNLKGRQIKQTAAVDEVEKRAALVTVLDIHREPIEIVEKYSGTIRPFERFQLSFKNSGRVMELGKNDAKEDLDVGDVVEAGQLLARLDTKGLEAQKNELLATQAFAQHEYNKALELRQSQGAISDTQFKQKETELNVAKAKVSTIQAQIDDGLLKSKVAGVISKRLIQPGESVGLGQTVFEIIQVDQVKLVVGVPESKIHRMIGPEKEKMIAYVEFIGKATNGKPKVVMGTVSQVGEASDEMSGLFEVEILLENESKRYRPGMIAIAKIVVEKYQGYKIPMDAVFVRDGKTFVFTFEESNDSSENERSMTKASTNSEATSGRLGIARKMEFSDDRFEFQAGFLVTRKQLSGNERKIIVGGHRRLVEGRKVKDVENANPSKK